MNLYIKHFSELSASELYDILAFRISVFVVEQSCPYQEADGADKDAYHIFLKDEDSIVAYLRVFHKSEYRNSYVEGSAPVPNTAIIGRVVSKVRRKGYATQLLEEAIKVVKEKFDTDTIILEAQVYAKSLYEKLGFTQTSEEFLEDGIPHIQMTLKC